MRKKSCLILGMLAVILLVSYLLRDDIPIILTYGWKDFPTHKPNQGCTWIKRTFSKKGISFFEQNCPTPEYAPDSVYYEDEDGRIVWEQPTENRRLKKIELYKKNKNITSLSVMQGEWYSKLTPKQQEVCEIRVADYPESTIELPRKTTHKVRYHIVLKEEIIKKATDNGDHLPLSNQYDFLCGDIVGAAFTSYNPYFEFDDRSPDKYLFIHPFSFDGLADIDSNSIRF